jgi:endoglucanase
MTTQPFASILKKIFFWGLFFAPETGFAAAICSAAIRFDTVGYLPDRAKKATIAEPCKSFRLVRASDGAEVFSGSVTGPVRNDDTNEQLYTADFSAFTTEGKYRIDVPDVGVSAPFRIAKDVYRDAFVTSVRGMYLWRCGMAVRGERDGNVFEHAACHTDDAWLDYATGESRKIDSTGGWHDAGDYNKYVVNAGTTVGVMLAAWEHYGDAIRAISLDIPESGGAIPDFLAEIKWEIDWLLTMQADDGSVYHKLSTLRFGGFVLPEYETEKRYISPWSTAATAEFVAMTAKFARAVAPYDTAYSDRCLRVAEKSYAFLLEHPENVKADLSAFRTGTYQVHDHEVRLWAAAELWETTGHEKYRKDFETRAREAEGKVDLVWDHGHIKSLGLLTYYFSKRDGRDTELLEDIGKNILATADAGVANARAHGYARPIGSAYYWGCNGAVARAALVLQSAYRIDPKPEYLEAALDSVHHLLGRNCHGRSYVTGLGALPPMHPHDRRCGGDKIDVSWPGYLVGGPNPGPFDWRDEEPDYRTNEIAINWNGALIYALAGGLDVK